MEKQELPVVVVGAGPVGLAAAAHLVERGIEPLVLEAGPSAATAVRDWAHVRLFSPWAEVTDPAAEKLLAPTGWTRPDGTTYPTGGDWAERYLQPLADVLGDKVRYGATVTGVARAGRDRIVDSGRAEQPFTVHIETSDGGEERITARAVIDASGTWSAPARWARTACPPWGEDGGRPRLLPRPGPQGPGGPGPVRRPAHGRRRLRRLRLHRARPAGRPGGGRAGHARGVDPAPGHRRGHVRRWRGRPAPGPRRTGSAGQGRRRGRTRERRHRVPHRGGRAGRRPAGPGRRGRPPPGPGRRGRRPDRLPPRPVLPLRTPPRPRRTPPGTDRAGPADRPERPLLRHGLPARREGAVPPGAGRLPGRHEVLRPRPPPSSP